MKAEGIRVTMEERICERLKEITFKSGVKTEGVIYESKGSDCDEVICVG